MRANLEAAKRDMARNAVDALQGEATDMQVSFAAIVWLI